MNILQSINDIFSKPKVNFGEEFMVDKASKGISKDSFYSQLTHYDNQTASPDNLNLILDIFTDDPIVNASITTRSNAILESGYTLEGAVNTVKSATVKLKELGFDYLFLDKLTLNFLLYGHVFIEIVRDGRGVAKELHILETTEMEIEHDAHGEILNFIQVASNGDRITFSVDDIIFLKLSSVSSKVWGVVPLKTLYRTLTTKNQIEKFINGLAITNAWRQVFKTDMHEDDIPKFMAYTRTTQADPTSLFVMQTNDMENKINKFETLRDPSDLKEFLGVLDYFRTQILMELKVPPIMIGIPDSTNRSSGDSQIKAFNIANESVRKRIAIAFNNELFVKIGLGNVEFSWNPIDKRNTKDDVEIAEKLMNMGAKRDQIEKFLRSAGVDLPEGEFFDEKIDPMEMNNVGGDAEKPEKENKADPMKEQKTGADSSTRENQLHK